MIRINNPRKDMERELSQLTSRYNEAMRGRLVPNARAQRLQREIKALKAKMEAHDRDAAERLVISKAPVDEVLEIIAIPLLADVINDVVAGVDGMLLKRGIHGTIFNEQVSQIRRAALKMVDTLAKGEEGIPLLLDFDDTLVEAVRKKIMSFIKQRLNIKK